MKCLIDGDILLYEIGFASEASWKHKHPDKPQDWLESNPPPWELVEEILEQRIMHIETVCQSDEPSLFFFTGKENFRYAISKTKPYKERNGKKPYHYKNIRAYLYGTRDCVHEEPFEADDLMAMYQTESTIICTRDKDLRQVGGWHFGWELGSQPQFGPLRVEGYGALEFSKKLTGWGLKFFASQLLTGDSTDSVPGLPGIGPKKAFEILKDTQTYLEGLEAVTEAYKSFYKDEWEERLTEQAQLLWMVRQANEDGSPVMWVYGFDYDT